MEACDTVDCSFVALLHIKLTGTFHFIIIQKDKHIPKAAAIAGRRSFALVGVGRVLHRCVIFAHTPAGPEFSQWHRTHPIAPQYIVCLVSFICQFALVHMKMMLLVC